MNITVSSTVKNAIFSLLIGALASAAKADLIYDFVGTLSAPADGHSAGTKMDLRLDFDKPSVSYYGPGDYGFIELGTNRTQLFADAVNVFSLDLAYFSETVNFGGQDGFGGGPGGLISFDIHLASSKRIITDPGVLPFTFVFSDFDIAHYVDISLNGSTDLSYTFDDILVNGASSKNPIGSPVPEPSTYVLIGSFGLAGLIAARGVKRRISVRTESPTV